MHFQRSLISFITGATGLFFLNFDGRSQDVPAVSAADKADDSALGELFRERKVVGTIILSSLDGKTEYVWNSKRAVERFMPASTFKVPHSLIALEEKAIADENELIKWDGVDRGFKNWNRDHTLTSAFEKSCVWYYQAIARRLDKATYLEHLKKLEYGNQKVGDSVATFWIDNTLQISAREQIAFLKRVYREDASYNESSFEKLKEIMVEERSGDSILRAKTGWGRKKGLPDIGWWIGYVESGSEVWFFALNIQIDDSKQSKFRKEIVKLALKTKDIFPPAKKIK